MATSSGPALRRLLPMLSCSWPLMGRYRKARSWQPSASTAMGDWQDHKGKMRPAERMAGDVRLERGGIRDGAPVPGPDSASHFLGLAERDGAQ
jgi:hypothetical protein